MSNLAGLLENICAKFGQSLLPSDCLLCAGPAGGALLCGGCEGDLPELRGACPRCALPVPGGAVCGGCLKRPPAFERALAAYEYRYPVAELVQAFKYGGRLAVGEFLARALVRRVAAEAWPELIVPLPLFPARLAQRGFNQAAELARRLALSTGAALVLEALVKVRDTAPQASLPWRERQANVRGAFACAGGVAGRRIVVVDDVMTSGATLEEAARTLKRAGAAEVAVWVAARAPRPG